MMANAHFIIISFWFVFLVYLKFCSCLMIDVFVSIFILLVFMIDVLFIDFQNVFTVLSLFLTRFRLLL